MVPFNTLSHLLQSWSLDANCVFLWFPMSFSAIYSPWFRFCKAELPLCGAAPSQKSRTAILMAFAGASPAKTLLVTSNHFAQKQNHWIQVVVTPTCLKDPKRTFEGRCPANTVAHQLFQVVKAPENAKRTTRPTQGGGWSLLKLCDDIKTSHHLGCQHWSCAVGEFDWLIPVPCPHQAFLDSAAKLAT